MGHKHIDTEVSGDKLRDIPADSRIEELLQFSPQDVLSFATAFFARESTPKEYKISVALRLLRLLDESDHSQIWESLCSVVRLPGNGSFEHLFQAAREELTGIPDRNPKSAAVWDFLGDVRLYHEVSVDPRVAIVHGSDYEKFVAINSLARSCAQDRLSEFVFQLEDLLHCDDFLIREGVGDAVGTLVTRSDLRDEDLMALRDRLQAIVGSLENDENPHVRDSAKTIRSLVGSAYPN